MRFNWKRGLALLLGLACVGALVSVGLRALGAPLWVIIFTCAILGNFIGIASTEWVFSNK
jgi:uncharacterized membrane protein AbrB (regulator of aidB expression)